MKYTVYIIRHISTGTVLYVGKTRNFKKRAYEHLSLNAHSKKWLSVIGTGNVLIEEVAKFDNETDALKYEDELILKYGTIINGYNERRSGLIESENQEEYQKEYQKKYRNTYEHKEYQKEYHKEYQKEYRQKYEYKEYQRKWHRKYHKTDKYINYQKEYRQTDEYKKYQRDYKKAKKIGISVAEYRKLKKDQDATLEQNKKQQIQLTINF